MADLLSQDFNATTPPPGWTDFTALGGSIDDSSTSTCTLSITTTAGSKARRRSPVVSMSANGDTVTAKLTGVSAFFTIVVLRQDSGSTAFCPAILAVGANWQAYRYRDATGYGAIAGASTGRDTGTHPWVRFRRVSATQVACEAAPDAAGSPGTWVLIGIADATADSLSLNMATTQLELMTEGRDGGTAGASIIDQVGDGTGAAVPTVTSIAPTSGPVGTEVTITGTNLTGATAATHGPTVAMTGLVVDSATQARATIASGSPASGTIRITTPGGTAASSGSFTIPPIFTSLEITNPNTTYTIGVLLSPITVRALDQFGATFLGTLADCVVSALTLPVTVIGTLTEPFVAGIATFDNLTPAESAGPPIEVITVATPLRCTVSLFPVTSVPVEGTSGGGIPTLIARTASDHVLRIEDIVHAITGAVIEPTDIRYRISDASGELVAATVTAPTNPDDWQIALSRALFTPTRGPMTLVLTLVAPVDSTETALQFTIAQGVRQ